MKNNLQSHHISMAVVCVFEPNRSSGALYQRVTTFGVIGFIGIPNFLAKPKSAANKIRRFKREVMT